MHIAIVDLVANPGAGQRFTGILAHEIAVASSDLRITLVAPSQALSSGVFGNTSSFRQVGLVTDHSLQRWFPNHRILNFPGSWRSSNYLRGTIQRKFFDLEKQILSAIKTTDLVYFPWPNFISMSEVFSGPLPMVMTVHDLLWKYIKVYAPSEEEDLDYRVISWLQRMNCVVAITNHLQTDLSRYFPTSARRVEVIHQAATELPEFHNDDMKRLQYLGVQKPYILMVAGTWGHKNHSNLLRAISSLRKDINTHTFIFAGIHTDQAFGCESKPGLLYTMELRTLYYELGLIPRKDILGLGVVSDGDLGLLYSQADAVIIPSLIEGCSLPLLEAAALRKPVLCSNISTHKEMSEYYGITPFFFDPTNPLDIERSLRDFLRTSVNKDNLTETAARVRSRSWADVAKQYIQIFDTLI